MSGELAGVTLLPVGRLGAWGRPGADATPAGVQ